VTLSYDIIDKYQRYENYEYSFGDLYCLDQTTIQIYEMQKNAQMSPDINYKLKEEELKDIDGGVLATRST